MRFGNESNPVIVGTGGAQEQGQQRRKLDNRLIYSEWAKCLVGGRATHSFGSVNRQGRWVAIRKSRLGTEREKAL